MDFLKTSIFDKLISFHSDEISNDEDYRKNVFNYLDSLKYQNGYDHLKDISKQLNDLKSKRLFDEIITFRNIHIFCFI